VHIFYLQTSWEENMGDNEIMHCKGGSHFLNSLDSNTSNQL